MKFGVLFTSHPDHKTEPHPHRAVHARVTEEVMLCDRLGYDDCWIAEHHFSNQYGILPDPFAYLAYLAAKTRRIQLGAAVMILPLHNPLRVAENTAFIDILSNGRMQLGLGSGYRPYEFEGLGVDFETRRDIQEEGIGVLLDAFHKHRVNHEGRYFKHHMRPEDEIFPYPVQMPHPPIYLGAGTERSIVQAAKRGFGLMLSTLGDFETVAGQIAIYRRHMKEATAPYNQNPAFGHVDVARWVYVAKTDAKAKADSAAGLIRHISHFAGSSTAGYLGRVSEKSGDALDYDRLAEATILHGSPDTVIQKIQALKRVTGATSVLLHYPPYYGHAKSRASLKLFAKEVMPVLHGEERPLAAAAE